MNLRRSSRSRLRTRISSLSCWRMLSAMEVTMKTKTKMKMNSPKVILHSKMRVIHGGHLDGSHLTVLENPCRIRLVGFFMMEFKSTNHISLRSWSVNWVNVFFSTLFQSFDIKSIKLKVYK